MHVDAYQTWTVGPGGAAIAAAARVEVVFQHPHHLLFGVLNVASRPSEVKVALIGRRIPELLEHLRVRYSSIVPSWSS